MGTMKVTLTISFANANSFTFIILSSFAPFILNLFQLRGFVRRHMIFWTKSPAYRLGCFLIPHMGSSSSFQSSFSSNKLSTMGRRRRNFKEVANVFIGYVCKSDVLFKWNILRNFCNSKSCNFPSRGGIRLFWQQLSC